MSIIILLPWEDLDISAQKVVLGVEGETVQLSEKTEPCTDTIRSSTTGTSVHDKITYEWLLATITPCKHIANECCYALMHQYVTI